MRGRKPRHGGLSSWMARPGSAREGVTSTSPTAFCEVVDLTRGWLDEALAAFAAHCARCLESEAEDVRVYGREGAELVKRLRAALHQQDAMAAAEAALLLGVHAQDWRAKDLVEADFADRIRQRTGRSRKRMERPHHGDELLRQMREWLECNPLRSREDAYRAIGGDRAEGVKKAILRAERRERLRS